MPPSLKEWIPEGDLAWFILDTVEQMDLKEFYAAYRNDGWGAAAYDPAMMVGMPNSSTALRSSSRISATRATFILASFSSLHTLRKDLLWKRSTGYSILYPKSY